MRFALSAIRYPLSARKGFTLIELIIYIGAGTMMLLLLTALFLAFSQSWLRSRARARVEENLRFAIQAIQESAASAEEILVPASGGSDTLTLAMPPPSGDNQTYFGWAWSGNETDIGGSFDTPVKLANPAMVPTGTGNGASFSPDNTYLAIAHACTPYVTIYKRSGDTFTKLANPATLPTGIGKGASFSPDNTYLAISHDSTPYVTIYRRSGDTFTKLANPATLPTGIGKGASFSPDNTYLAIAHTLSPNVTIYKGSGDTFTKLANPATLPIGTGNGASFSPDNTYLAIAHTLSPNVTIYKGSGWDRGANIGWISMNW